MTWILERLKERSTWAGIISLITVAGVAITPEQQDAIITAGLAIVSAVFVFTADKK